MTYLPKKITLNNAPADTWYHHIYDALKNTIKNPHERQSITRLLLEHFLHYNLSQHILSTPLNASPQTLTKINDAITRLHHHEPIQYILGKTEFLSHTLHVNPSVLIPRPETETMVYTIIQQENLHEKYILDLCTGSGCIAIALKKAFPSAHVHALDISFPAIHTAQKNAQLNHANITFHQQDLLLQPPPQLPWSLIVSNPPYIPQKEKKTIAPHVLHHEPPTALFVPDHNPCLFYTRIANIATQQLLTQGTVYVETHEHFHDDVAHIFQQHVFTHTHTYTDLHDKKRFLKAIK